MKPEKIKIIDGLFLKRHTLDWCKDGYLPPPDGWIPDDLYDLRRLAANLMLASDGTLASIENVHMEAWSTIEGEHYDGKQPWPGWVPWAEKHTEDETE